MNRSAMRLAVLAPLMMTLLAACSSTRPPAGSGGADQRAEGAVRRGGYYLDDGPGDALPADLNSIPDAVPRREALNPGTARPYVVFDRRYVPMTALEPYRERGVASWYGRRYHGRKTSSGEVYDMYAMTAAHTTLPIPSYARVTHLGNGRSVVVRVNDRGPFLNGRLIDLSYAAAAKLGYANAGSAEVEVELITRFDREGDGLRASPGPAGPASAAASPAPATGGAVAATGVEALAAASPRLQLETVIAPADVAQPAEASSGPATIRAPGPGAAGAAPGGQGAASGAAPGSSGVYLQLGAFSSRSAAETAKARLTRDLNGLFRDIEVRQEGALFKVQAGPFAGRADALAAAQQVERSAALRPVVVTR